MIPAIISCAENCLLIICGINLLIWTYACELMLVNISLTENYAEEVAN